jgi:nickel-dependent lactate racemase
MADGGELIIFAPGVKRFGEDAEVDKLIRKYGYSGRENIIKKTDENADLRENQSAAAHLIHGSTEGRFTVTYAADKMTREEIEGVGYKYMQFDEALKLYNPDKLSEGENSSGVYFIKNPALGLWACKD